MAKLLTCAECGKSLSSNLTECPHCGGNPYTSICSLCGKKMKMSEGERLRSFREIGVHTECMNSWRASILSQTFECPVCHARFTYRDGEAQNRPELREWKFTCKKCGERIRLLMCEFCDIAKADGDNAQVLCREFTSPNRDGTTYIASLNEL